MVAAGRERPVRPDEGERRWPMTGREGELAAFARTLADRRSQGFAVFGPAGVGKSRLAEECLTHAVREGFRGAKVTASAAAATVPLGAIAQLLPAGVDLYEPVARFAAVAAALAGQDRGRRWMMWVDDLHLLDPASAVLLRQLMDTGVVRLIATVRTQERTGERTGEPAAGNPIGDVVAALTRGDAVHRVDLGAFDEAQVDRLLRRVLGVPVTRRTLRQLYDTSGGNALYLRELVHGALVAGTLRSDGEVWGLAEGALSGTPQLTGLIEDRLAAAGAAGRPVLELIALCEPLPLADAEAVAPPDVLAALEAARLIRGTRDRRRTTLALAHSLYGEILRAGLPAPRRRALLLQQAERTEARGLRRRDDELRTTSWRLAATGTADPHLLGRAARLAQSGHDYRQVVTLLEAMPGDRHSPATKMLLGDALFHLGRWDEATAVLAAADAAARGEQEKLAVTLIRTTNLLWSNTPAEEAFAVNDAALDVVRDRENRHVLRVNEGWMRVLSGQPRAGLELLADLETDVDQARDLSTWLRGALMKPCALAFAGRTREAVEWSERAYLAHQRVDEHARVSQPAVQRASLVLALAESGRLRDARALGEQANADLNPTDAIARIWLALMLGRTAWAAGHPRTSRHWWAEATALARAIRHTKALHPALSGLAACAAVLGDLAGADLALAELDALPPPSPGILPAGEDRLGQVWALAARGRAARARAILTADARLAREAGHVTGEAQSLVDVARLGGAADVTARLAELAAVCDGSLAPARARLAAALAGRDPGQLLECGEELERLGADLLAAEAITVAAAAWHSAGESRNAAAASRWAASILPRCEGAATPLLATAGPVAPLTPREREIAARAAAGHPSKEIAHALTLSVRTIDNNLRRVYAKLGVSSRGELTDSLGEWEMAGTVGAGAGGAGAAGAVGAAPGVAEAAQVAQEICEMYAACATAAPTARAAGTDPME